ncbi:hypothetical protein ABFS82_14G282300 [Erythranthe guttata]
MTARSRLLGGVSSPPPKSTPAKDTSSAVDNPNPDLLVIVAGLLCALICVLGLVTVARCPLLSRIAGRASASPAPPAAAPPPLPRFTYGDHEDNEHAKLSDCAICLAEFAAGEEIRVLPQCGHGFHVVCIDTWLGSHSSCPSCRQVLEVARCRKCGRLPESTCSAAAAGAQPPDHQPRQNFLL